MNPFPIEELKNQLNQIESNYRFSDDMIFASKMKAMFSENYRRSGRSFLFFRALIETSIEEFREVTLFDHYDKGADRDYRNLLDDVLSWYEREGVKINYTWRPVGSREMKIHFTMGCDNDSHEAYNKIRISTFVPKIEEERQFSKLLLIL